MQKIIEKILKDSTVSLEIPANGLEAVTQLSAAVGALASAMLQIETQVAIGPSLTLTTAAYRLAELALCFCEAVPLYSGVHDTLEDNDV